MKNCSEFNRTIKIIFKVSEPIKSCNYYSGIFCQLLISCHNFKKYIVYLSAFVDFLFLMLKIARIIKY